MGVSRRLSRRGFLKSLSLASLSGIGIAFPHHTASVAPEATVARVVSKRVFGKRGIDRDILRHMLDNALMAITGRNTPLEALASIFKPDDVVGIKVNCIGGRILSTRPELAMCLAKALTEAGVNRDNIIIWDRFSGQLRSARYPLNIGKGTRCVGVEGKYSSQPIPLPSGSTRFARLLTERITALVSMPVMKDHYLSGVTLSLKNVTHGSIENPADFHAGHCAPGIADIFSHKIITSRIRLVVCDALIACYDGGPTGMGPATMWQPCTILASCDPVAADTLGLNMIDEKRRERRRGSVTDRGTPPLHISAAAGRGLGQSRLEKIRVEEISP